MKNIVKVFDIFEQNVQLGLKIIPKMILLKKYLLENAIEIEN